MAALTQEKIDELRSTFGEVFELTLDGQTVMIKVPSIADNDRWIDKAASGKLLGAAARTFAKSVVVYPDAAEWDALVARRPNLAMKVVGEASAIASGEETSAVKK